MSSQTAGFVHDDKPLQELQARLEAALAVVGDDVDVRVKLVRPPHASLRGKVKATVNGKTVVNETRVDAMPVTRTTASTMDVDDDDDGGSDVDADEPVIDSGSSKKLSFMPASTPGTSTNATRQQPSISKGHPLVASSRPVIVQGVERSHHDAHVYQPVQMMRAAVEALQGMATQGNTDMREQHNMRVVAWRDMCVTC